MIAEHDLVLDCTDNVAVRNQLNAGCFAAKVPLVSGAAIRMEGQITVFTYQDGEPCYRCLSRLFGENALTCVEAGVMAPLIGVIGSLQAMEAIKLLAGYGKPASGKIVMYDAMTCQFREMKLMRNPGCEVCGQSLPPPGLIRRDTPRLAFAAPRPRRGENLFSPPRCGHRFPSAAGIGALRHVISNL